MNSIWKKNRVLASLLAVAGWWAVGARTAEAVDWKVEVVDTSGVSKFTSMRVDKDGNVHVAYVVDDGNFSLKYAFWDHQLKKWFTMYVDGSSGMCSLALDSKQQPHISYTDYGSGWGARLKHAYWDGTTWHKEAIHLDSEIVAFYNSIAFDLKDNPSLTFYEYRGAKDSDYMIRLRNVMWNGHAWEVRTVDPNGGSGKFNTMAADSQGHIHIAYANVAEGDMRYAYWDGKVWTWEMVETQRQAGGYVGQNCNIALDQAGIPHVTYADMTNRLVKYAVRQDGRWQIQTIDRLRGVAYPDRNSITLDDQGNPYITYYDAARRALKMAYRDGTRWLGGTIDGANAGFTSSVQISQGTIWISYADEADMGLKVAHTELQSLHEPTQSSPVSQARK